MSKLAQKYTDIQTKIGNVRTQIKKEENEQKALENRNKQLTDLKTQLSMPFSFVPKNKKSSQNAKKLQEIQALRRQIAKKKEQLNTLSKENADIL